MYLKIFQYVIFLMIDIVNLFFTDDGEEIIKIISARNVNRQKRNNQD